MLCKELGHYWQACMENQYFNSVATAQEKLLESKTRSNYVLCMQNS